VAGCQCQYQWQGASGGPGLRHSRTWVFVLSSYTAGHIGTLGVWCSSLRYAVVWYGVPRYGVVWYVTVLYAMTCWGTELHSMVLYGMVRYSMVEYGMAWYGMARHGMAWHGMVWYGYLPPGRSTGHLLHYIPWCTPPILHLYTPSIHSSVGVTAWAAIIDRYRSPLAPTIPYHAKQFKKSSYCMTYQY